MKTSYPIALKENCIFCAQTIEGNMSTPEIRRKLLDDGQPQPPATPDEFDFVDQNYKPPQIRHAAGADNWNIVELPGGLKMEMVKIHPGEFMMGSDKDSWGHQRQGELPRQEATIQDAFWIGKFVVTNEQFEAVIGKAGIFGKIGNPPHYPVIIFDTMTFAMGFCQRLNCIFEGQLPEGYHFNFPSEVQWEYACKAGTDTPFNNNMEITKGFFKGIQAGKILDELGWHGGGGWAQGNSDGVLHRVGQKPPNDWGLYDMHGNVWELVWQCYKEYGTNKLDERELGLRGGDFNSKPISCRSATRCCNCNSLTHKIGLRLALTKKWSVSGEIFDSTLLWKVHDGKLPQNAF